MNKVLLTLLVLAAVGLLVTVAGEETLEATMMPSTTTPNTETIKSSEAEAAGPTTTKGPTGTTGGCANLKMSPVALITSGIVLLLVKTY